MGEVLPLDRLKPAAVLLLRTLPLGGSYGHICIPMGLKNFWKRYKMLQMDGKSVLLDAL
jgi:hypothetical protein